MLRYLSSIAMLSLSLAGCGFVRTTAPPPPMQTTDASPPPPPQPDPPPPSATRPANNPEPLSSPQALAWTTQAYAQEIQPQIKPRPRPAPPDTQPALIKEPPRSVQWIAPPASQPARLTTPFVAVGPPATHPLPVSADPSPPPPAPAPDVTARLSPQTRPANTLPQDPAPTSDQLETQLARHIRDYPRDLAAQLDYQILQLLRGRQVPQMDAISSLPPEDRELISALMDALSNFRTEVRSADNILLARKARPLLDLADRIRAQTSLRVPSIAVCQKVYGFGAYEPLPPDRLVPGREVVVYCEVDNFSSRLNDRNTWQTNLTQEIVLYNDRGQRALVAKREPFADFSRNRRRDFCVARKLLIPASLPPGLYSLTATISDQQVNRMAEATIPIRILSSKPEFSAVKPD